MKDQDGSGPGWAAVDEDKALGWDYRAYYVKSTNEHDHSVVLNLTRSFKLPVSLQAQIQHWVNHPLTPYRSPTDIIRDAVTHRLQFLAEQEDMGRLDDFNNANAFYALEAQIMQDEAFEIEMQGSIETITKRATALVGKNDITGLERLYDMARRIQIERRWQARWLDEVNRIAASIERLIPDDIKGINDHGQ